MRMEKPTHKGIAQTFGVAEELHAADREGETPEGGVRQRAAKPQTLAEVARYMRETFPDARDFPDCD